MTETNQHSRFYFNMGLLLLGLVILGFGSTAIMRDTSPLELPLLFHIHGVSYVLWFSLFTFQANLIGSNNHALHKQVGLVSLLLVPIMIITAFLMSGVSYERGVSPIPEMGIKQFLALPVGDLIGLVLFFTIAILNRHIPLTHKHAMLVMSIAIMDPALTRLGVVLGFAPLGLILHFILLGLVIFHDRKTLQKVHWVTWLGLVYLIWRPVFLMTIASGDGWANLMDTFFAQ